jgi:hypothetical protein
MSNTIQLAKQYVPILDQIYKNKSLTAVLDGAAEVKSAGSNANEIVIPKISMDGLADYSRNGGYVNGSVNLVYETVKCNFDRGRTFSVDYLDNAETANVAFGKMSDEFIRTKVAPELDAFRFATYAGTDGIGEKAETLSAGADVISALRLATNTMDEAEVSTEDRYLFITPSLDGLVKDLDTTKSREVYDRFTQVILVPQTRFYTAISQLSGGTGEETGGYTKADGAADINFMVVEKSAVIQYQKHVAPKIISAEANQDADAWKFGYRTVGIADVYENKVAGIYVSHK